MRIMRTMRQICLENMSEVIFLRQNGKAHADRTEVSFADFEASIPG